MTPALKVVGFLGVLGVVFGLAAGAGNAVSPLTPDVPENHASSDHATSEQSGGSHAESLPGGLMVSQDGYTLRAPGRAAAGKAVAVDFTITDPDGHPVTDYQVEHERQLHLIAVRRDFQGFQHVHPTLDADGRWHTELDLTPGPWRIFADFKPAGATALTLGSDLLVSGQTAPADSSADRATDLVDGYRVALDGRLTAGESSPLRLTVTKAGRPVDVEPYLGASGHLVALRDGDLAYLHVHPEQPDQLAFAAAVPSIGRYHLFLDFKVDGVVRTASFVATAQRGHDDDH